MYGWNYRWSKEKRVWGLEILEGFGNVCFFSFSGLWFVMEIIRMVVIGIR